MPVYITMPTKGNQNAAKATDQKVAKPVYVYLKPEQRNALVKRAAKEGVKLSPLVCRALQNAGLLDYDGGGE